MKRAVFVTLVLCLFVGACASTKEELLLKGIGAMAKEDAYKTQVLIGGKNPAGDYQEGILQFAIRQNPGNPDLLHLKSKVEESAARCLEVAERMAALVKESPKLSQEQKVFILNALQEAMKIWKGGD